jgi:YVTN family beta-propeller protein/YD repeat-containing protein
MTARFRLFAILLTGAVACLVIAGTVSIVGADTRATPSTNAPSPSQALPLAGNVTNITVGSQPTGVLYDAQNHRVYVANYAGESVSVIDPTTMKVVKTIDTHHNAWELALDPANGQLFVTNGDVGAVSIINTTSEKLAMLLKVGCHHAVGAVYDAQTGYVYVECDISSELAVVNPVSDTVLGYIEVHGGASNSGIAIDPTTEQLFVADFSGNRITAVNTSSNLVQSQIPGIASPDGTFYDPLSNTVYATLHYSAQVALVDASTLTVTGFANVGGEPHGAILIPTSKLVLVANTNSNNVSVFDASTNVLLGSVAGGDGAWQLSYDPAGQLVFVTDHWSSSVLAIPAADF